MNIRIEPFTVMPTNRAEGIAAANPKAFIDALEGHDMGAPSDPITYWGLYLDNRYITHSSNRELAEKTKDWMEKWLRGEN